MVKIKKKGQGLSINAIILAAIALIVLVVLVAIFTGRLGLFSKGLGEATSCDQICKARGYASGVGSDQTSQGHPDKLVGAFDQEKRQCYCGSQP